MFKGDKWKDKSPTVIKVVVIPAGGCTSIGPLCKVMTWQTGSALITTTPSAALTGGEAPLTTPPVSPEPSGTL